MTANGRLGLMLAGVAALMVGAAFAAVPLYRLFCQVTGYAGTPKVTEHRVAAVADPVTVRFNTDVNSALPWKFEPAVRKVTLPLGQEHITEFIATNTSDAPLVGTATFNVTPLKAASYFAKMECFCFTEQRLEPGQTVRMPVAFYVDPAIRDDPLVREVKTLTLSYTFFKTSAERGG